MKITLKEDTHAYVVDGDIASISVTELLSAQGIAPDYSQVDKEVLSHASDVGKSIHKDIEDCVNNANYKPETPQGIEFKKYADKHISSAISEVKIAYNYKGMIIAGTCDLLGFFQKTGLPFIADHKTTNVINREYVAWQTSIYDFMFRKLDAELINGQIINWHGTPYRYCFHFDKNSGTMKVIKLPIIPDDEIIKLFEAQYKGEKYERPDLFIDDELSLSLEDAEYKLAVAEQNYKKAKEYAETFRAKLLNAFETQNITKYESDNIKATYTAPCDHLSVDATKLKKNYPEVYNNVLKDIKVKASISITCKNAPDDDEISPTSEDNI